jgi:Lipocalin-like domain
MKAVTYTSQCKAPDSEQSSYANRLVGVWSLVAYTVNMKTATRLNRSVRVLKGFLIYTADGFVSAQLMKPVRPAFRCGRLASWNFGRVPGVREWVHRLLWDGL